MKINAVVNGKNWLTKNWCEKGFNWNPSNCECEFDKSWEVGEYLNYKNCNCRKRLADKLVEEYNENIDEKESHRTELHLNKMIYNLALNDYAKILVLVNAVPVQYA